jgi:putative oxidoreductase
MKLAQPGVGVEPVKRLRGRHHVGGSVGQAGGFGTPFAVSRRRYVLRQGLRMGPAAHVVVQFDPDDRHATTRESLTMFEAFVKNTLAALLLRLALAAIFIYHGFHLVGDDGNQWGAAWMNAEAANHEAQPPAAPVQLAVAWGQLLGGIALAVGFLTRLAALGIIAIMAGAIATVHWPNGFDISKGGYEYNMLIVVACLTLLLLGGGTVAVDRFFRLRRKP